MSQPMSFMVAADKDGNGNRSDQRSEIIMSIMDLTGGKREATRWYEDFRISALGGSTAEELVARGEGGKVLAYIKLLESGAETVQ